MHEHQNIDWSRKGYPTTYTQAVQEAWRYAWRVLVITGIIMLVTLTGSTYFGIPPLIAALAAAFFFLFGLLGGIGSVYDTARYIRLMPYFERQLGGIDTFIAGQSLASYLQQLDLLARYYDVQPLSTFGFADDMRGETLVWHDAHLGVQCITTLLTAIEGQSIPNKVRNAIKNDLVLWEQALLRAKELDVKFCVLLMHGNSTSGHESDIRKGSAF